MRTFGKAKLRTWDDPRFPQGEMGQWEIEAEPHVMMRLRRVFAAAGNNLGVIRLTATPDVCRDLLWFVERYPLEVSPREVLEERARQHEARLESFARLVAGEVDPRSFELAIPARDYQRLAADLLLTSGSLLVADDVGVGKTAVAIAAMTDPGTRPTLVVTLTHLCTQWKEEIGKFAPSLWVHIIRKGRPYDVTVRKGRRRRADDPRQPDLPEVATFPDVLVSNYAKLFGWAETLAGKVKMVVFDEVQELRTGTLSKKGQAARHIAVASDYRLGLSATPIYNYGGEMYNVLETLTPNALGRWDEFHREWCSSAWEGHNGTKAIVRDSKAFGAYLREAGLMIRRTRADCGRELPPLSKVVHHVDADIAALDDIEERAVELARFILQGVEQERGDLRSAAGELDWRLRQATGIAKAPYVATFVNLLVESGERVLLYGWHREVYAIWKELLSPWNPSFYTGTESVSQKEASKQRFLSGESQVLVMSLRAGAGLDGLQAVCRTTVHGELDWSPGVHEQCTGRIFRDGQADPVMAYFPLANIGSDPVIASTLGLKRQQIEGLRDPHGALLERVDDGMGIRQLAAWYLARKGKGGGLAS